MIGRTLLAIAALSLAATPTLAAAPKGRIGPNGVIATPNGLAIATRSPAWHYPQGPIVEPGLTKIFDNLSHYPDGVYWCCTSFIVSGPNSEFGAQSWIAAPFTPNASLSISKIVLGLSHDSGNNTLVVALNSDNDGLPGAELASATVSGLPDFPGCCVVVQAKFKGLSVSAGQQYWVVVKTNRKSAGTLGGWAFNDTEQVIEGSEAVNSGSGWEPLQSFAAPAFEVLGQ
jgi:hypothetical protein